MTIGTSDNFAQLCTLEDTLIMRHLDRVSKLKMEIKRNSLNVIAVKTTASYKVRPAKNGKLKGSKDTIKKETFSHQGM